MKWAWLLLVTATVIISVSSITLERYSHTAYAFPCVGNSAKEYCLGYHDGAIQAHRDFNTGQDVDVDQHPCRHNITEYYNGYSRGYNDEADFLV